MVGPAGSSGAGSASKGGAGKDSFKPKKKSAPAPVVEGSKLDIPQELMKESVKDVKDAGKEKPVGMLGIDKEALAGAQQAAQQVTERTQTFIPTAVRTFKTTLDKYRADNITVNDYAIKYGLRTPKELNKSLAVMFFGGALGAGLGTATGLATKYLPPAVVSKFAGGELVPGLVKVAVNPKTAAASAGILGKIAVRLGIGVAGVAIVSKMIDTYPFAEWGLGEAKEIMNFAVRGAMQTGDADLIKEMREVQNEIHDITLWENIQRAIPWANIRFTFVEKTRALRAQKRVNDRIMADEIKKIESGETEDECWDRVKQQNMDDEKEIIDYYEASRKQIMMMEEELVDKRHRLKMLELEKQKEIAKLKMAQKAYVSTRLQMRSYSTRGEQSGLGFGLL